MDWVQKNYERVLLIVGIAIRSVTGDQEQQDAGRKLREPDQSEIERAVRQAVNLPAHGNRLHFRRCDRQESRQHVVAEVRIAECGASRRALGRLEIGD